MEPYHPLSLLCSSRLGRGDNLTHHVERIYQLVGTLIKVLLLNQVKIPKHEFPCPHFTYLPIFTMEQVPVSIADLGGTEIDLRFGSANEGRLSVIVAPVLRFLDSEF